MGREVGEERRERPKGRRRLRQAPLLAHESSRLAGPAGTKVPERASRLRSQALSSARSQVPGCRPSCRHHLVLEERPDRSDAPGSLNADADPVTMPRSARPCRDRVGALPASRPSRRCRWERPPRQQLSGCSREACEVQEIEGIGAANVVDGANARALQMPEKGVRQRERPPPGIRRADERFHSARRMRSQGHLSVLALSRMNPASPRLVDPQAAVAEMVICSRVNR